MCARSVQLAWFMKLLEAEAAPKSPLWPRPTLVSTGTWVGGTGWGWEQQVQDTALCLVCRRRGVGAGPGPPSGRRLTVLRVLDPWSLLQAEELEAGGDGPALGGSVHRGNAPLQGAEEGHLSRDWGRGGCAERAPALRECPPGSPVLRLRVGSALCLPPCGAGGIFTMSQESVDSERTDCRRRL